MSEEAIEAILVSAGQEALDAVHSGETVEVSLEAERHRLRFDRIVVVTEGNLAAIRQRMPDTMVGDEMQLPLFGNVAFAASADREWGDVVGTSHIPGLDRALEDRLTVHLAQVMGVTLPVFAEGTLGGLLQAGGGWLCGISAASAGFAATVVSSRLRYLAINPNRLVAAISMELDRTDGLVPIQSEHYPMLAQVEDALRLPVDPRRREAVAAALVAYQQGLVQGCGSSESEGLRDGVLLSAVNTAQPDTLWSWLFAVVVAPLAAALEGWTCGGVSLATVKPEAQSLLRMFGKVRLEVRLGGGDGRGVYVALGRLGADAMTMPPPQEPVVRDWIADLPVRYLAILQRRQAARAGGCTFSEALPEIQPLRLAMKAAKHGVPPPPPLPAPHAAGIAALAGRLRLLTEAERVSHCVDHRGMIAGVQLDEWTVIFSDDTDQQHPFTAAEIHLRHPGGDVTVMLTGRWDARRYAMHGQPLHVRRLVDWIRGALLASGQDVEVRFGRLGEGHALVSCGVALTEWLWLGEPWEGEGDLIDWRVQHTIVSPDQPLCVRGSFGLDDAARARMVASEAQYHRFLGRLCGRDLEAAGAAVAMPVQ